MEYKKAIEVLFKMIDGRKLKAEEKGAVLTAIKILDCGVLADNRLKSFIKSKKAKKAKAVEWK